jgi:hypothetical protein
MAPISITTTAGLHTSPNPLESPPGALQEAMNVVVRRRGVIESRRGFARQDEIRADPSNPAGPVFPEPHSSFSWFKNYRVAHCASDFGTPSKGHLTWATASQSSAFTLVFDALQRTPTFQRLRMAEASGRLWIGDRANTLAIGPGGSGLAVAPSGLRPPPDIDAIASVLNGASGWMANTAIVAYRYTFVVWLNGRVIESAPSGRFVITNGSGGTRNVSLNFDLPAFQTGGTPTHLRIYRSEQVLPPVTVPGDELFLCAEYALTGTDLTNQTATVIDTQPESLLGEPLYTNPITGAGILDANYPPPNGVDVALWDGRLWVANTRGPSRAEVLMVGVGASAGVQNNDTIVIFGTTLTAVTAAPSAGQFQIYTGGSPAQNVDQTARNLVTAVNNLSGRPLSASYVSTDLDAPGLMTFWRYTSDGLPSSNVTVSRASAWQITQQTTIDLKGNGLSFSKPEQPDAFPPTNTLVVNTSAAEILRIFPLRDRLYVFKADGIYVVSGSYPYRVDLLDGTCILLAPDAVADCNGSLYALTTQGVVAVSDSGARIMSLPIEDELRGDWQGAATGFDPSGWSSAGADQWIRSTFATSYELERLVYFWLAGKQAVVLNTMQNTWLAHAGPLAQPFGSTPDLPKIADAAVEPTTGRMWLMRTGLFPATDDRWWQEKKNLDRWDFADQVCVLTGVAVGGSASQLTYTTATGGSLAVGDAVIAVTDAGNQADGATLEVACRITAIGTLNITLDEPLASAIVASAGTGATIIIERGIPNRVTYSPITGGQPSTVKRFREATLHFTSYSVESADILAETDMASVPTPSQQGVDGPKTLWTAARSGPLAAVPRENKRRLIPRDKQMGAQILITWALQEAFATWALCGLSLEAEGVSERNSR